MLVKDWDMRCWGRGTRKEPWKRLAVLIVQPDVPLEQEQTGITVVTGRVLTVMKVDTQKMDPSVHLAYSGVQVLGQ